MSMQLSVRPLFSFFQMRWKKIIYQCHNPHWVFGALTNGSLYEHAKIDFVLSIFYSQTDGSVPNTLVIANCEIVKPRVAAAEHISQVTLLLQNIYDNLHVILIVVDVVRSEELVLICNALLEIQYAWLTMVLKIGRVRVWPVGSCVTQNQSIGLKPSCIEIGRVRVQVWVGRVPLLWGLRVTQSDSADLTRLDGIESLPEFLNPVTERTCW